MSHLNYTTKSKKGQHLSYEERQKIEILLKAGHKLEEIGKLLGGRSKRTIQCEIALGKVKLLNSDLTYRTEYSADAAQNKRNYNNTAKGPKLKLGANFKLIELSKEKARMAFSFRCVTSTKSFSKSLVTFYIAIFKL